MGQKFVKVKNIDPIKGSTRGQKDYMSDQQCLPSTGPRCGTANRMERIVGGQNTSTKRWPWIVYLTIFSNSGAGQCAGTFINDKWILTANHCILNARYIMATAGATFTQAKVNDNIPAVSHYKVMQRVPFNSTIGYDNFHQDDIAL